MDKYKSILLEKARTLISEWTKNDRPVTHREVYKFLHSLSGTAPTIGLTELGASAACLIKNVQEDSDETWLKDELFLFLSDLLTILYEEDANMAASGTGTAAGGGISKQLVVLIDDDTALLMYIKDELEKQNYAVIAFAEPERAAASLFDLEPDCIIIDVHMHSRNGLDVLTDLKRQMKKRFIPVIMISVDSSKATRMKSYELGADDFIPKPFDLDEFFVRVKRQTEKKRDIDELVMIDELTRVFNRKYLRDSFERIRAQIIREKQHLSAAVIDLDHFKKINDKYGHLAGDKVLVRFADLLKRSIRPSDVPFRFGGEEFLLLLPKTEAEEAKKVLERILAEFSEVAFSEGGESFSCTFSAGIAQFEDYMDYHVLMDLADSTLYEAKKKGRGRVLINDSSSPARKKVLHVGIIDDDPIIRTILQDLFRKSRLSKRLEFDIRLFQDGMSFLESDWYGDGKDDEFFIILDGVLPEMDGIEVLKKIRQLEDQKRYTVIMLTSRKSEEDIAKALHYGADDYLTKPFKLAELESRLQHLIKRVKHIEVPLKSTDI